MNKKQKLYCYVDETGQDTAGALFIVSVVVSGEERENLTEILNQIEHDSGKGRVKWMHAKAKARLAYMQSIFSRFEFKGKLYYSFYRNTREYLARTVLSAARTVTEVAEKDYETTVFVDGLPKSLVGWFGSELRHLHIRTKKVRGVRKEESDALMRLADALCGFARTATGGHNEMSVLLKKAKAEGYVKEI